MSKTDKPLIKFTIIIVLILSVISCRSGSDFVNEYMSNYPNLNKKKILYFDSLYIYNDFDKSEISLNNKKVFLTTIYSDCNSCLLTLTKLEQYLSDIKLKDNVLPVVIAIGEKSDYFKIQTKELLKFSFPIFSDDDYFFIQENNLEGYEKQTFLLNENHEIILVGNLFENDVLKRHYEKIICR